MITVNSFIIKDNIIKKQSTIDTGFDITSKRIYLKDFDKKEGSILDMGRDFLLMLTNNTGYPIVVDFMKGEYTSIEVEVYLEDGSINFNDNVENYIECKEVNLKWSHKPCEIVLDKDKWEKLLNKLK